MINHVYGADQNKTLDSGGVRDSLRGEDEGSHELLSIMETWNENMYTPSLTVYESEEGYHILRKNQTTTVAYLTVLVVYSFLYTWILSSVSIHI